MASRAAHNHACSLSAGCSGQFKRFVASHALQIDEIRCEPPFFERIATLKVKNCKKTEKLSV